MKIADSLNRACNERDRLGAAPGLRAQILAASEEWSVEDVWCTLRPNDPAFEERHERYRVALVGAGNFQCRGSAGRELLTPGSFLLGNAGEHFECGHEHGTGDRCLAFAYSHEMFARLAADAGVQGGARLPVLRVPPLHALAGIVADAGALWTAPRLASFAAWEELAVRLAAAALRLAADAPRPVRNAPNAERGVARAVRLIEHDPCARLALTDLAREARLSRFHFIRAFAQVTGLSPHRYVRRARLRAAAVRLAIDARPIVEVALSCGFRDVSNFNHAFRVEFGTTPRQHRARQRRLDAMRSV